MTRHHIFYYDVRMDISCIILTWNSERYIQTCLNALFTDLKSQTAAYEVFVVDNGSRDATVSILHGWHAAEPDHLRPIYLERNAGTTYSRNLALKAATGQYVCILDCDVEVSSGAIDGLIRTLERAPNSGLAAPRLLYPNGQLQKSTDRFPTLVKKLIRYFFLKRIEQREHHLNAGSSLQNMEPCEVDYAISALWMLKREVISHIGLLDEKIVYAPEDVDYCLRIWQAGYTVVYDPAVTCIHHTQEISRGFKISRATVNHVLGLLYYFRKHRYLFHRPRKQA